MLMVESYLNTLPGFHLFRVKQTRSERWADLHQKSLVCKESKLCEGPDPT